MVDHFNYDSKSASDRHDVLLLPGPKQFSTGTKNYFGVDKLIAFPHAVGNVLGNASPLLASVLKAPSTAYAYNPKEEAESLEDLFASGDQISLVSAFQARNSARLTVLGSAESLEDKWFDASVQLPSSSSGKTSSGKTDNREFAKKLSAWTFKELGVLKVGDIEHHLNEVTQKASSSISAVEINPSIYRIKNDVHYSIELSEWEMDHWAPFTPAPSDNVQLEFSIPPP